MFGQSIFKGSHIQSYGLDSNSDMITLIDRKEGLAFASPSLRSKASKHHPKQITVFDFVIKSNVFGKL